MEGLAAIPDPVYPRACGGTVASSSTGSQSKGLSPRVRGNRRFNQTKYTMIRSIPARAGEPARPSPPSETLAVYPRACGGTASLGWR